MEAVTSAPPHVDWREAGAVTAVRDQGHCGSCWTFSTTGTMESHHFLKYGEMKNLSEQQLVDCADAFNNHGCNGGLPSQALCVDAPPVTPPPRAPLVPRARAWRCWQGRCAR